MTQLKGGMVRDPSNLKATQDCEHAPAFELGPEQRMSFCWFQPEGPLRLRLRLGSQECLGGRMFLLADNLLEGEDGGALLMIQVKLFFI